VSGLSPAEHRRAGAEQRRARNAAARARRAAPVVLLRAHDPLGGGLVWIATSRSTPGAAYVLREGPDGRLLCSCQRFGYRGDCAHLHALDGVLHPGAPPEGRP
jgi:hypothetical protein